MVLFKSSFSVFLSLAHKETIDSSHATLKAKEKKGKYDQRSAYLITVHLELAHHFDGHFVELPCRILGAVDIAEGAVAHLLHQNPAIQTGIFGHLRPIHILFCHQAFNFDGLIAPGVFCLLGGSLTMPIAGIEGFEGGGELAYGLRLLLRVNC